MTAYRVTYWNMSDGINQMIIAASTPAEAEAIARQRDELFAQIKQTEYIGDTKPMKTPQAEPLKGMTPLGIPQPAPTQQAEAFREEIRTLFKNLHINVSTDINEIVNELHHQRAELDQINAALTTITAGIQHAATATPPTAGTFSEMEITSIIMTYDDKGKPAWKAVGTPYNKFGVRVWDEVLPALGIDPASLHPGPNTINPIRARVLMKMNEEGKPAPQKVTGKV